MPKTINDNRLWVCPSEEWTPEGLEKAGKTLDEIVSVTQSMMDNVKTLAEAVDSLETEVSASHGVQGSR